MSQKDWDDVLQQREAIINGDCFADLWHIKDIKGVARTNRGIDLSTEQARKALARMEAMYDPNSGIHWDSVSGDIDHVLAQEKTDV